MKETVSRLWDSYRAGNLGVLADAGFTPSQVKALRLVAFMRYVEDNAANLGISFDDTQRLGAISQAYGSAFFPEERLMDHAAWMAGALGMDGELFRAYVADFSRADMRTVLDRFDLRPGQLSEGVEPAVGWRLYDFLRARTPSLDSSDQHFSAYHFGLIATRLLQETLDATPLPDTVQICDPACGSGFFLSEMVPVRAEGVTCEITAFDCDAASVCQTAMNLLLAGYRGDFSHVRCADALDPEEPLLAPDVRFDGVLCEPSFERYAGRAASSDAAEGYLALLNGERWSSSDTEARYLLRAASMLSETGAAVLVMSSRLASSRADRALRAWLVRKNLVDAVVELGFKPAAVKKARSVTAIWLLRRGRPSGSGILLGRIGADGLDRAYPDFIRDLNEGGDAADRAVDWLVDMVRDHREYDLLSREVSRKEVLSEKDCALRYASYADSVDVLGRLERVGELRNLVTQRGAVQRELEKASAEFETALRAVEGL